MKNNLKTKDFVFLAIISAIYMVLYMIIMVLITPLGAFGHAVSPGLFGILGGTVIYFIAKKLGKMWQFSILSLIVMGLFAIMGGGYLPWFITTMLTAIIADFMVSREKEVSTLKLAIAFGIMQIGQAWGAIVPAWFFLDAYRETWIKRGQDPAAMNQLIHYTQGIMGVYSTIITFILAFIGVYIGHLILKEHFKNKEN